MFSGSYLSSDVKFLLNVDQNVKLVTKKEKEDLIASGGHYSSVVVTEEPPSNLQANLFFRQLDETSLAMSHGIINICKKMIKASHDKDFVLMSLVRAGTPLGILIKHTLSILLPGQKIYHYGVSIIRDKGLDVHAMTYIQEKHPNANYFFIDGWTGKGTITKSLQESLKNFKHFKDSKLVVYSDIAYTADISYDSKDWLIPFSLLNSTVSGLISRTVYKENDFHSVYYFQNLERYDVSNYFINIMKEIINKIFVKDKEELRLGHEHLKVIDYIVKEYDVKDLNKLKPSISECTRALLRRIPKIILIRDYKDPELELIIFLANQQNVLIIEDSNMGHYKAIAILE